jgi:class 3 adenylate cyclase/TolB-like protein
VSNVKFDVNHPKVVQITGGPLANSETSLHRKQAAIMFTDIVGFTKAMSRDEDAAFRMVQEKRSIITPLISINKGVFVKEMGDGTLSYFDSTHDAATCAIKLQQTISQNHDMDVRVGINSGVILMDANDVFGDVVNVAARLESIAPIGGVCVSKEVFDELLDRTGYEGTNLGLQQLKNVGRLVEVYALKAENLGHPDLEKYEKSQVQAHSGEDIPSLAVLPFKNKGKDEDEFYAYGICADLISDLSSAGKLRVISMNDIENLDLKQLSSSEIAEKLNARYLISGQLWKHGEMFQLSVEVYDSKTAAVLWSDRWQESWAELISVKGKLADGILKIADINPEENSGISETITSNAEAYELYLKGKHLFERRKDTVDTESARKFLVKAIDLDPNFVRAKIILGTSFEDEGLFEKALELYEEAHQNAVSADDQSGKILSSIFIGHAYHSLRKL